MNSYEPSSMGIHFNSSQSTSEAHPPVSMLPFAPDYPQIAQYELRSPQNQFQPVSPTQIPMNNSVNSFLTPGTSMSPLITPSPNSFYPKNQESFTGASPDPRGFLAPIHDQRSPVKQHQHPFRASHQISPDFSIPDHPSLTPMPSKRSSREMDDYEDILRPATKQQLTERKLFEQFGSLHLDSISRADSSNSDDDSDDSNSSHSRKLSTFVESRQEFQRYVYLLFKDKKSSMGKTYDAIERLAREERDKLSKALVLWNPPVKHNFNQEFDDADDVSSGEEFTYSDHTDFLKVTAKPRDSVIITDVTDQICNPSLPINNQPTYTDPDELMSD